MTHHRVRRIITHITAAMFVLSVWAWLVLPAQALVPVHWTSQFQPDRFVPKLTGIWSLPLLAAGTFALLALFPRGPERDADGAQREHAVAVAALAVVGSLALVHAIAVVGAMQFSAVDGVVTSASMLGR